MWFQHNRNSHSLQSEPTMRGALQVVSCLLLLQRSWSADRSTCVTFTHLWYFSDSVDVSMSLWCNFTVNNATCCICFPRVSVIWMLQIRDIAFVLQFSKCSLILTRMSHWFFLSFSHSFASISGKNLQLPWKRTAAQKQKLIVYNGLINHPTWANHRATRLA